jgi:hypothetical protein
LQLILHVIPAGIGLNHFSGRLGLRPVVGQEEGRRFVPQPRHDQLPHGPFVAVKFDPFLDRPDLAVLALGLSDLTMSPVIRGELAHACQHARATAANRDEADLALVQRDRLRAGQPRLGDGLRQIEIEQQRKKQEEASDLGGESPPVLEGQ